MSTRLKPFRKDEELAAIPVDQPVLVELGPEPSGTEPEKGADRDTDQGVKTLEEQLAASKEAERRADEGRRDAERRATEATAEAEKELLSNSLAGAQSEEAAAKEAFKKAFEAGDSDAMADAQSKIGRAAARILQFEGAVAQFEEEAKAEKDRPEPQVDIVTAIDRDPKLMAPERDWLKAHTETLTDTRLNRKLGVAYDEALAAGHKRGSDGYFKFLDQFMGYAKASDDEPDEDNSEKASHMSAPVSREATSSTSGRPTSPTRVTLTPAEREIARSMGVSDVNYAKGKLQLEANKKSDPEKFAAR